MKFYKNTILIGAILALTTAGNALGEISVRMDDLGLNLANSAQAAPAVDLRLQNDRDTSTRFDLRQRNSEQLKWRTRYHRYHSRRYYRYRYRSPGYRYRYRYGRSYRYYPRRYRRHYRYYRRRR